MTSPLTSRDGVEVVAALLGHKRPAPPALSNVRILDLIFEEVVDSLRMALPDGAQIEAGAAAVTSVLNALEEQADSSHAQRPSPNRRSGSPPQKRRRGDVSGKMRRPQRQKRYHDATPSTHCHVCCRPNTAVPMAVCSNIKTGTCRKVVCNRCISANGWNWDEAALDDSRWICPHCMGICQQLSKAQCLIYMKTNSRRRMNGIRKRKTNVGTATAGVSANINAPNAASSSASCVKMAKSEEGIAKCNVANSTGGSASNSGSIAEIVNQKEVEVSRQPEAEIAESVRKADLEHVVDGELRRSGSSLT